ncbi:MAG: cupin domain-containing protein [Thaumarchaeota archaeon]|nr:cupin domain-containing protein [Nitrososphaerota archaeon]MCL5317076.1 cupin domain-containing protein [Nitrososphaerota archaeon]
MQASKGPDPAVVASNVYKTLMENDRVRVFDVHFKPGAKAKMHWHPDHVGYVLQGGKLNLEMGDGTINEIEVPTGKAVFMETQTHQAVNPGKSDIHLIVIELKK